MKKNELSITPEFMTFARKDPSLVIFKIADGFTKGIPDTIATSACGSRWAEFKVVEDYKGLIRHLKQKVQQLEVACDLEKVGGRIMYVVWFYNPHHGMWCLELWAPSQLKIFMRTNGEDGEAMFAWIDGKHFDQVMAYLKGEIWP